MKKSHSSKQWLRRHVNDPYVQRSKKEGYRSRSVYKLIEIDERDKLLRAGLVVVDLGQADFTSGKGLAAVEAALGKRKADVVLSDMAPNMTGIPMTDQARSMD